jgi:hypothetical protein
MIPPAVSHPYRFPAAASVDKAVPKTHVYRNSSPSSKVKEVFVRQVEKIIWSYKLSRETVNVPPGNDVEEIQIFTIVCKGDQLEDRILSTIDKAIPSPILFIIQTGETCRYRAARKRSSEADSRKWVVGQYFGSQEFSVEDTQAGIPLPVVSDLGALYEHLLRELIPLEGLPEESLDELISRTEEVLVLERECGRLQSRVNREKQFNRRVELNRRLNRLQEEIHKLSAGTRSNRSIA